MASATEYVETWFLQRGFGQAFTQTCTHLRERVVSVFQRAGSGGGGGLKGTMAGEVEPGYEMVEGQQSRSSITGPRDQVLPSNGGVPRSSFQGAAAPDMADQSTELFGGFEFEDLWDMDFMVYDEENPLFVQ